MKLLFTLLIGLLLNIQLIANDSIDECNENDGFINESLYHKKITDQGSLGVCTGYSIAQLYTALAPHRNSSQQEISPLFVSFHSKVAGHYSKLGRSLKHNRKILYSRLEGGHFKAFFDDFKEAYPCRPKYVEKFIYTLAKTKRNKLALQKTIDLMKLYKKKRNKINESDFKQLNVDYKNSWILLDYIRLNGFKKKKRKFGVFYLRTLYYFFVTRNKKEEGERENVFKDYKVSSYSLFYNSPDKLIKIILKNLKNHNMPPIGLTYQISQLTEDQTSSGQIKSHSSLIIGTACKNRKRYFLIRNSWGGKKRLRAPFSSAQKSGDYDGDFYLSVADLKKTWANGKGSIYVTRKIKKN